MNGRALGGHVSRVHPNSSAKFAQKRKRYEERTFDRELLRTAKSIQSRCGNAYVATNKNCLKTIKRKVRDYLELHKSSDLSAAEDYLLKTT